MADFIKGDYSDEDDLYVCGQRLTSDWFLPQCDEVDSDNLSGECEGSQSKLKTAETLLPDNSGMEDVEPRENVVAPLDDQRINQPFESQVPSKSIRSDDALYECGQRIPEEWSDISNVKTLDLETSPSQSQGEQIDSSKQAGVLRSGGQTFVPKHLVPTTWFEDNKHHEWMQDHPQRKVDVKAHFCVNCNRPSPKLYRCSTCKHLFVVNKIDEHEKKCATDPSNAPGCQKEGSQQEVSNVKLSPARAQTRSRLVLPCGRVGIPRSAVSDTWFEDQKDHEWMQPHPVRPVEIKEHISRCCNHPLPPLYLCNVCDRVFLVTRIDDHEKMCMEQ